MTESRIETDVETEDSGVSTVRHARRHALILLVAILLLSLATKLYFGTRFSTFTDEILSATVAESIYETGLPWLPSGTIYYRAPLHHYLLAVPVGLFGLDYLPMRINSILASLVLTVLVFQAVRQSVGTPLAAVAALALAFSAPFNVFALSGRMYGSLALFFILTVVFANRGFLGDRVGYRWLTLAAMVATMLSSEAGLLVGPVVGLSVVLVGGRTALRHGLLWVGLAIWLFMVYLMMIYELPQGYSPFTAQSGAFRPSVVHLGMSTRDLLSNLTWPWRTLDRALPGSLVFFLMAAAWQVWKRQLRGNFLLVVLLLLLISSSFLETYVVQHRMVVIWIPLYFACGAIMLGQAIASWRAGRPRPRSVRGFVILLALCLIGAAAVAGLNGVRTPSDALGYFEEACGYRDPHATVDMAATYARLAPLLSPEDRILVTTVEYAWFFLGPQHDYYYLRQYRLGGRDSEVFVPFEAEFEPYYGRPLVDSEEDLDNLLESAPGAVWWVTDYKFYRYGYVGDDLQSQLEKRFVVEVDNMTENESRIYRASP